MVTWTLTLICLMAAVFTFFYLDHCYDVVIPEDVKQNFHELCKYIATNHSMISQNDTIIQQKCKDILHYEREEIKCELDFKVIGKYFDLGCSIGFTIG